MHIARKRGKSKRLFKEGTLPATKYNTRPKKGNNEYDRADMPTHSIRYYNRQRFAIKRDSEAHNKTIERSTPGLFYCHYGKIIPPETEIKTYWFKESPKIGDIPSMKNHLAEGHSSTNTTK
jgi:hypothetical protein